MRAWMAGMIISIREVCLSRRTWEEQKSIGFGDTSLTSYLTTATEPIYKDNDKKKKVWVGSKRSVAWTTQKTEPTKATKDILPIIRPILANQLTFQFLQHHHDHHLTAVELRDAAAADQSWDSNRRPLQK